MPEKMYCKFQIVVLSLLCCCLSCSVDDGFIVSDTSLIPLFPQSENVVLAILSENRFDIEKGTFVVLGGADETLHVQVSSVFRQDDEDRMREQVKRDLVYAAFKAFAQTSVETFRITSIPIFQPDNLEEGIKRFEHQKSFVVHRKTGTKIIQKHFDTSTYRTLYTYNEKNESWETNDRFLKLQYELLDDVYRLLVKE